MDERDVVELSFRLPIGDLGQLARLMEQARGLLAMEGGGAASPAPGREASGMVEREVNTAFDAVRFQQMGEAKRAAAEMENIQDAVSAGAEMNVENQVPAAPEVSVKTEDRPEDAVSVHFEMGSAPEAISAEAEVSTDLSIPAAEAEMSMGPETPVGSVEAADRAEMQAASVKPADDGAPVSIPLPVVPETRAALDEAQSAGITVETSPAEARGGVFAAVEELVSAGPAPLTAEAVALAFQRDDRRYDNGFPLY